MEEKALILLYLITNAFRTYVIFRFLRLFWKRGRGSASRQLEFLAYFLFYMAVCYSYLKWNIPLVTLAVNICGLLLVSCVYHPAWKSRVFAIVFCYAVLMCTETITIFLFDFYNLTTTNSNPYDIAWNSLAITLLPFAFVLILEKVREFRAGNEISGPYCLAAIFVPATSVYLAVCVVRGASRSLEVIMPVFALLILNVVVFYLYDRAAIIEQRKREEEILKRQNQYYHNQYELMNAALANTKSLRHDLKNHWAVIGGLLEKGEIKRASDYAVDLISDTYGEGEYARSGCLEIDSILNFKLQQAAAKGIHAELALDIPADLEVDPSVAAVVFGNLLDNAREAAAIADDKWMNVSAKHKKGMLFLDIENSYDGVVLNDYKSRKTDAASHGIGLANVERSVREHHGVLKLSHDDKVFRTNVFFYLKKD